MAPEQLRGEVVDARADLYALGCLLYVLLAGRPPFAGDTIDDFMRAHLESAPVPPSRLVAGLPAALDDLTLRLLAKQPSDRVGHAGAVAAALARLGAEGPSSGDEPRPRAYLYRARFAGRDGPMAEAGRRLAGLAAGTGGLLLVEGESGVGKTRLALEVARAATRAGALVLAGECRPGGPREAGAGGVEPLEALRRPLQAIADRCRQRGPREARRLLGSRGLVLAVYEPAIAALAKQEQHPEPSELTAGAARLRLFSALSETLGALAESKPVVLILDDLQWADELTLGWLAYLLRGGFLERGPILVVGTYRSEEAGEGLRALAASPRAASLRLGRLEATAVAAMVGDMLALTPPPRLLSQFLSEQSEGNPFFVAEYLRAAVEEGLLWRDEEGGWQVAERGGAGAHSGDYERLGLPRSLRALVERRLDGLPEWAAAAVAAAAVAGREVSPAVLRRMSGLGDVALLDATEELLRRRVLEDVGSGRLRFAHDKLREVAYGGLGTERRARLHRSAAEALEELGGPEEEPPARLGHHWEHAGEPAKAAGYYLAGARNARLRYANAESVRLYRAYLALAGQPSAETVAARNELGNTLRISGRMTEAAEEHRRALEEAALLGDLRAEGESAESLGRVYSYLTAADTKEAGALFERALARYREAGDAAREASALTALATTFSKVGAFDQARNLYEQALAIQQAIGDRRGESVTLRNLGVGLINQGYVEDGRARVERSLAIARECGVRHAEGLTLCVLADARKNQGALGDARSLFEQALQALREVGDRPFEGLTLVNLAVVCTEEGRVEEAAALYEQALAVTRDSGDRRCESIALMETGVLERRAGDLDEAERRLAEAEALLRETGDRVYEGVCLCRLGHAALARGRSAAPLVERARGLAAEVGASPEGSLGRAISQLERAAAAAASGRPLHRGECAEDIPEGLRRWLAETGRLASDSPS
jgi:predicted ATPase